MSTTKINCKNPITKKREIMALDNEKKRAKNSKGNSWSLKYLKQTDKNGIGFFETYNKGILVQKSGEIK